jgi:hypothetical protein
MTSRNSLLLSGYPRRIPIARALPIRRHFSLTDWDPRNVHVPADLPPYLILGTLDETTFQCTSVGWSARWLGVEPGTWFHVAWSAAAAHYEIHQSWQGIEGPCGEYDARLGLDKIIGLMLYHRFPKAWDKVALDRIGGRYQLTYIPQQPLSPWLVGIPDGALRDIVFPVPVTTLRRYGRALRRLLDAWALPYPVTVEARLLYNAVNYVEGKAPDWTRDPTVLFNHSLEEMGAPLRGVPVREVAASGSAAWTIRRELYYLFIGVPFAGLTDLLGRLRGEEGPIRSVDDPQLRFELRPFIVPAGFECHAREFSVSDAEDTTTRHFVKFPEPEEALEQVDVSDWLDIESRSQALISDAEQCTEDFYRRLAAESHGENLERIH